MNRVQRGSEGSQEVPAYLDRSATVVNWERRAFPDTPGQEVLLVLTDPLGVQDCRDS